MDSTVWRNKSVMWRNVKNICYVEKFLHMTNVFRYNLQCSVAKSVLQFMLFCHKICSVAIYALLRVERFNNKLVLWRKMTTIRYGVCFTENSKLSANFPKNSLSRPNVAFPPKTSQFGNVQIDMLVIFVTYCNCSSLCASVR